MPSPIFRFQLVIECLIAAKLLNCYNLALQAAAGTSGSIKKKRVSCVSIPWPAAILQFSISLKKRQQKKEASDLIVGS